MRHIPSCKRAFIQLSAIISFHDQLLNLLVNCGKIHANAVIGPYRGLHNIRKHENSRFLCLRLYARVLEDRFIFYRPLHLRHAVEVSHHSISMVLGNNVNHLLWQTALACQRNSIRNMAANCLGAFFRSHRVMRVCHIHLILLKHKRVCQLANIMIIC